MAGWRNPQRSKKEETGDSIGRQLQGSDREAVMAGMFMRFADAWQAKISASEVVPCGTRALLGRVRVHDVILLVEHDDAGLPSRGLSGFDFGETHDDETVTRFAEVGRRSIEDNLAALARHGVSLEAGRIGEIAAKDALKWEQAHLLHQIGINRQAALVLRVAAGNAGAMDFRF
jgi:hypothetical protein